MAVCEGNSSVHPRSRGRSRTEILVMDTVVELLWFVVNSFVWFSVMASSLLEMTGDFLGIGLDKCCSYSVCDNPNGDTPR